MPPTDTTPASLSLTKHPNRSKSPSTCQGGVATRGTSPPGAILLLHFDSPYREELAFTLRAHHHKVLTPETNGKALSGLQDEELAQADFVIFDLSRVNSNLWSELRHLCRFRRRDGLPVMLMCWSRIYRGPAFQLLVEKLGVRFVYAN